MTRTLKSVTWFGRSPKTHISALVSVKGELMWRRVTLSVVLLLTLGWLVTLEAVAFQDSDLVYSIRFAMPTGTGLQVQFGNDVPPVADLEIETNWIIIK